MALTIFMLLTSLCIGALWSIMSAISGGLSGYFAVLAALVVHLLLFKQMRGGFKRGFAGFAMLVLALGYQLYLKAAATINAQLGLGILESLRSMGPEFAFAIAKAQVSALQWNYYGAALALVFALGFWHRKTAN